MRTPRPQDLALLAASLLLAGCTTTTRDTPLQVMPDMDSQGKGKPQSESKFFADGRSSRLPVSGTVARGHLREDDALYTGIVDGYYVKNPLPINEDTLKRGHARFDIYCTPCHDRTGHGKGVVPARSLWLPTDLHEDRVKGMVDGEIFHVISHGRRSMPAYRFQIPERDRWAIIAYLRALQRTTSGTIDDVPQDMRSELR